MTIRHAFLVLLAAASFTACARGPGAERAQQMRSELQQRFATADANADGRLTRDEARGGMPWVHRNFDAIDGAGTGSVTMAQIESYAASRPRGRR